MRNKGRFFSSEVCLIKANATRMYGMWISVVLYYTNKYLVVEIKCRSFTWLLNNEDDGKEQWGDTDSPKTACRLVRAVYKADVDMNATCLSDDLPRYLKLTWLTQALQWRTRNTYRGKKGGTSVILRLLFGAKIQFVYYMEIKRNWLV